MQPAIDLRIRSMIKALSETVLPAVDQDNKAALEQLHITLGSLALLNDQIDHAYAFEVADLRDLVAFITGLAGQAGAMAASSRAAVAEAQALADGGPVSLTRLRDAGNAVRAAITDEIGLAYARLDSAAVARLQSWLLANTMRPIARERAFVAATGFDVFPETLRPVGELLGD